MHFGQWKRREFFTLLGGAVAWPLAAGAQQPMPVIGFLGHSTPDLWASRLRAFRQGLSATGYDEGRNVTIEYRWAEGQNDRLPALAADLVHRQVAVIAAPGSIAAALASKAATTTIPIVFESGADPVRLNLITSLRRPGSNVTGVTSLSAELGPKRLEFLHQMVPGATRMAFLVNPTNAGLAESQSKDLQAAAGALGLELHTLHASTERDFDAIVPALVRLQAGGLVIGSDALFSSQSGPLGALMLRHAVPAIYVWREFVLAGGLMSYGPDAANLFRLAGGYTGRILKGERPADLPSEQATKVDLLINLKTAKALGLTVPLPLLGRADEVIE
jgi:putative tryptophan/tyrosine transport system substrate-binding protein